MNFRLNAKPTPEGKTLTWYYKSCQQPIGEDFFVSPTGEPAIILLKECLIKLCSKFLSLYQ